jgi:hypothetical protein
MYLLVWMIDFSQQCKHPCEADMKSETCFEGTTIFRIKLVLKEVASMKGLHVILYWTETASRVYQS